MTLLRPRVVYAAAGSLGDKAFGNLSGLSGEFSLSSAATYSLMA